MCDYSLHLVASRPAKVADKLVSTDFVSSITRGFTEVGQPEAAVCLLPGTEIAFDADVQYDRAFSVFGRARIEARVARFRQINMDDPHVHHDALEFPGGQIVMVTRLIPGQTRPCCNSRHCRRGTAALRRRRSPAQQRFANASRSRNRSAGQRPATLGGRSVFRNGPRWSNVAT